MFLSLGLVLGSAILGHCQGRVQDIVRSDNIVGSELNVFDYSKILVQFLETDETTLTCVNVGDSLSRTWSGSNGIDAALRAHLVSANNDFSTGLCGEARTWAHIFRNLFAAWDFEDITDGGSALVDDPRFNLMLSYAKSSAPLKRDERSSADDRSYTLDASADLSGFLLLSSGSYPEPFNFTKAPIGSRATVVCQDPILDRYNGYSRCTCENERLYEVDCTRFTSSDTSWTRAKMNAALLSVIGAISPIQPDIGEVLHSNPRGAALFNGYQNTRNYLPRGDRQMADCCRSAIQAVVGRSSIPLVPASCSCSPVNMNWMMSTGASFANDRIEP